MALKVLEPLNKALARLDSIFSPLYSCPKKFHHSCHLTFYTRSWTYILNLMCVYVHVCVKCCLFSLCLCVYYGVSVSMCIRVFSVCVNMCVSVRECFFVYVFSYSIYLCLVCLSVYGTKRTKMCIYKFSLHTTTFARPLSYTHPHTHTYTYTHIKFKI